MPTIKERLDQALDHVKQIGAEPVELALTQADYDEFCRQQGERDQGVSYRGMTARRGQIGQMSYIRARKPDGSESNFGF